MLQYGLALSTSTAPTVIASGAEAGDVVEASRPSLPAATMDRMPELKAEATAALNAGEGGPPRDMEMTDVEGEVMFETAQAKPDRTIEVVDWRCVNGDVNRKKKTERERKEWAGRNILHHNQTP